MQEFETTIEVTITIKYRWNEGQRGCRDSMGVPEEPDEDAHAEDIEVIFPRELDSETMDQIREECEEDHAEKMDQS